MITGQQLQGLHSTWDIRTPWDWHRWRMHQEFRQKLIFEAMTGYRE